MKNTAKRTDGGKMSSRGLMPMPPMKKEKTAKVSKKPAKKC